MQLLTSVTAGMLYDWAMSACESAVIRQAIAFTATEVEAVQSASFRFLLLILADTLVAGWSACHPLNQA